LPKTLPSFIIPTIYNFTISPMNQDEKIANMSFSSIYPHYLAKIEKKWRTKQELEEVIFWLTWYNNTDITKAIDNNLSFKDFFDKATLNPDSKLITWTICGSKVEDIENLLTQKVRYLDKLVDELAKWKTIEKILRKN